MRSRRDKKRARERDRNKRSRKYGQIKGKSAAMVGSFGVFDMILACIGIVTGVKGFKERDKNYLTCKIGIVVNGFILLALILVFIRGCV